MKIGLLSDTHSYLDEAIYKHFKDVDEIWHAGDIGNLETTKKLEAFKPLRAVYGNIDNHELRRYHNAYDFFLIGGFKVLMVHIGGYPNKYDKRIVPLIEKHKPQLFISGHSHILKVMFDHKYNMLHINPGSCGINGFHKVRTLVRFEINQDKIEDLEVIELYPRYPQKLKVE